MLVNVGYRGFDSGVKTSRVFLRNKHARIGVMVNIIYDLLELWKSATKYAIRGVIALTCKC